MCLSRVYLGVHSLWDILTGVTISVFILFLAEPLLIRCDPLFLSFPLPASLVVLLTEALLLKMYPRVEWWSPDLGDTGAIVGSAGGALIGSCFSPPFRAFLTRYCSDHSAINILFTRITTHSVGQLAKRRLSFAAFTALTLVCRYLPPEIRGGSSHLGSNSLPIEVPILQNSASAAGQHFASERDHETAALRTAVQTNDVQPPWNHDHTRDSCRFPLPGNSARFHLTSIVDCTRVYIYFYLCSLPIIEFLRAFFSWFIGFSLTLAI